MWPWFPLHHPCHSPPGRSWSPPSWELGEEKLEACTACGALQGRTREEPAGRRHSWAPVPGEHPSPRGLTWREHHPLPEGASRVLGRRGLRWVGGLRGECGLGNVWGAEETFWGAGRVWEYSSSPPPKTYLQASPLCFTQSWSKTVASPAPKRAWSQPSVVPWRTRSRFL